MRSYPGACILGALTGALMVACAPARETKTAVPEAAAQSRSPPAREQ